MPHGTWHRSREAGIELQKLNAEVNKVLERKLHDKELQQEKMQARTRRLSKDAVGDERVAIMSAVYDSTQRENAAKLASR